MSQVKDRDKTLEKQLNEVEIGNLPEKNNDNGDDPGPRREKRRRHKKCLTKT